MKKVEQSVAYIKPSFQAHSQNCEKGSVSFVMSVCRSVRMEQLGCHWTEILYLSIFRKFSRKFQVSLKCDTNDGHVT